MSERTQVLEGGDGQLALWARSSGGLASTDPSGHTAQHMPPSRAWPPPA